MISVKASLTHPQAPETNLMATTVLLWELPFKKGTPHDFAG